MLLNIQYIFNLPRWYMGHLLTKRENIIGENIKSVTIKSKHLNSENSDTC